MTKLKMIPCPKCGNPFPELRKTKYGYNFCVNCSTIEPVVGVTTVEGSGDHTYNDLIIMDQSQWRAIAEKEAELRGQKANIELIDFDEDENEVSQSIKEGLQNALSNEDPGETVDPENDTTPRIKGIDY
jgi:ssDNA-binding Zn-finger/Zn-ribbon topoisomerase 1